MEHVRENLVVLYQDDESRRKVVYYIAAIVLSYGITLGLYRRTCLPFEYQSHLY
jgi:hypothetical protein